MTIENLENQFEIWIEDYTSDLSKFLETCDLNIQKLNIEQLMKQYP